MRTLRLSLAGTVILALLGGMGSSAIAQAEEAELETATIEVIWELPVPSEALPDDFVKLVIEDWTLAPSTDTAESTASVLGNEALRGRGLVIETGELSVTPATEAMLWRGTTGDPQMSPAGEPVTLAVGDAIFLPAVPDDEVDRDAPIVIVNAGAGAATARSFHTHQSGGSYLGFPTGLTLGEWNMASDFQAATREALNGVDVVFRLTRTTGQPGAIVPIVAAPAIGLYFVAEGELEQVSSGPGGEITSKWPAGKNGLVPRTEGVEQTLHVVGDQAATVLEFAAIPQRLASD
jgi:hypothetical protein